MTNQVIPAQAVEAAHRAICEDDLDECLEWRGKCVKAVEAAAPHIRAQALLDAAHAAIDPTTEDIDKYFIDQSDTGLWLRARAAAERPTP